MEFNPEKFEVMHFGRTNKAVEYTMNDQVLGSTEDQRDLGVHVHRSLKTAGQVHKEVQRHMGYLPLKFIYLSQVVLHLHCNEVTVKIPSSPHSGACLGTLRENLAWPIDLTRTSFGLWEETGAPGRNPRRHRENVQTPHRE